MELALRFFIYRHTDRDLRKHSDLNEYITFYMQELFNKEFNYENEELIFEKVFSIFNTALGEDSFKRYEAAKYSGPFVTSVFEVLAVGLSTNDELLEDQKKAIAKIKDISSTLYQNSIFKENMKHGTRATKRFIHLIDLGKQLFKD
jgi:hypothetical protein